MQVPLQPNAEDPTTPPRRRPGVVHNHMDKRCSAYQPIASRPWGSLKGMRRGTQQVHCLNKLISPGPGNGNQHIG